jgi:hypothetical protein
VGKTAPSLTISEANIAQARSRLLERSGKESWGQIARSLGLPWSTVYHFAKRGYTPKRPDLLAKLVGKEAYRSGIIIQEIHRDDHGRFAKRDV